MKLYIGQAIARSGKTQTQVASDIGVSKGYVSDLISNKKMPSLETLIQICTATDSTPNDILGFGSGYWPSPLVQEQGFSEPSAQLSLSEDQKPPRRASSAAEAQQFVVTIDNQRAQITAVVDHASIDHLIKRLESIKAILSV